MTCRRLCRPVLAGAALSMFSFPAFLRQPDVDPAMMCDAAASADQAYALDNDDPDKDAATARATEG